jgi:hypothetical protein
MTVVEVVGGHAVDLTGGRQLGPGQQANVDLSQANEAALLASGQIVVTDPSPPPWQPVSQPPFAGIPSFAAYTHYPANYMVLHAGGLYYALVDFSSGASFNVGDWGVLGSDDTVSIPLAQKGMASGVGTLDSGGKQPVGQLASSVVTDSRGAGAGADVPMNGHKVTGLADATAATDALNRESGDARYPLLSEKDQPSGFPGLDSQSNVLLKGYLDEVGHHLQREKGDLAALHFYRPGPNDRIGLVGPAVDIDPTVNKGATPAGTTVSVLSSNPYATKTCYVDSSGGAQTFPLASSTMHVKTLYQDFPSSGRIAFRASDGNTYMLHYTGKTGGGGGGGATATGTLTGITTATGATPVPGGVSLVDGALVSVAEDESGSPVGTYANKPASWNAVTTEDIDSNDETFPNLRHSGIKLSAFVTQTGGVNKVQALDLPEGILDYATRGMSVYFTTPQVILASTATVILWDTVEYDDAGWYNAGTGLWTPKLPGLYRVVFQAQFTGGCTAGTIVTIKVLKNGSVERQVSRVVPSGANSGESWDMPGVLVEANGTTDTIGAQITQNDSASRSIAAARNLAFMQIKHEGRRVPPAA